MLNRILFVLVTSAVSACSIEGTIDASSDGFDKVCVNPPIPEPYDACDEDNKTTNLLVGTCYWEKCLDGEKSLRTKIAGVPCVYIGTNNDFAIGSCKENGECSKPNSL